MALQFDPVKLQQIRQERGLSQNQLGKAVTGHGERANAWERGRATPNLETIGKIAKALDVPYTALISDEAA